MRFGELPEGIRVKLHGEEEKKLWKEVGKIGVQEASERTGFKASKIYGWKSRHLFLPASFVEEFIDPGSVAQLKGSGRAEPLENVNFPLEENAELATRQEVSVTVNRDGVPVYQTSDAGNLERFAELLEELGCSYTTYSRRTRELRYPAFVQKIVASFQTGMHFPALVDETGSVEDGRVSAKGNEIPVEEFEGRLYSSKRLDLALQREDRDEITSIIAEERLRAESILR